MKNSIGRVGKRECASLVCIGALVSGLFALNTEKTYADGNSAYVSTLLAALLSLLLFLAVLAAMKRCGAGDLNGLFDRAFGRAAAGLFSAAIALALLIAAALPLIRILIILCRYLFVEAAVADVAIYFVPCLVIPLFFGFETIARTAKLFLILTLLSFVVAYLVASPSFDVSRLYPLLGDGWMALFEKTASGMERFLPALTALLIMTGSAQGLDSAAESGRTGMLVGGTAAAAALFLLGLIYPYGELAKMHAPMYRITMAVRMGSAYLRTDKILLFFWTIAGLIAALFYIFAAAAVYCRACNAGDTRPTAACFGMVVAATVLIGHENYPWTERTADFLAEWLWVFFAAPAAAASILATVRGGVKAHA